MNALRSSRILAVTFILILAGAEAITAMDDAGSAVNDSQKKIGVLVIAHGSDDDVWCGQIRRAVKNVSLPYPVELGFLEFVEKESIKAAADKLQSEGVTEIIAVPLFVSSYSSHIQEIEYILGLRDSLPEGEKGENLQRINASAGVTMTRALDDHPLFAYILADYIAGMSRDPANETMVILAHGTDAEGDLRSQVCCQSWPAGEIKTYLRYWTSPPLKVRDVRYAFLHGNETLYQRQRVLRICREPGPTSQYSPLDRAHGVGRDEGIAALGPFNSETFPY